MTMKKLNRVISAALSGALIFCNFSPVLAEPDEPEEQYTYTMYKEGFEDGEVGFDIKANEGYNYASYQGYKDTNPDNLTDSANIAESDGNKYAEIKRFGNQSYDKRPDSGIKTYLSNETGISLQHTDLGFTGNFVYKAKFKVPDEAKNKRPGIFLEATTQIRSDYTGARAFFFEITKAGTNSVEYSYQGSDYDAESGTYTDYPGRNRAGSTDKTTLFGADWNEIEFKTDMKNRTCTVTLNGVELFTAYFQSITMTESRPVNINSVLLGVARAGGVNGTFCFDDIEVVCDSTDELEKAEAALDAYDFGGDLTSLTNDISLPKSLEDCDITWQSDNRTAISDDGKITRRNFTQTANLTARITPTSSSPIVNNTYVYKKIQITIPKNEGVTDEQIVDDILNYYLTYPNFTDEDNDRITKNLKLPQTLADGCLIEWTTDKPSVISASGSVTRPAVGAEPETVTVSAKVSLNGVDKIKEFTFTVLPELSARQKLEEAMAAITYDVLTAQQPTELTQNLTLPSVGLYDIGITWTSSRPEIISEKGSVKRPDETTDVKMTATFNCGGVIEEKEFDFTVILSCLSMAKKDAEAVTIADKDAIKSSFVLPLSGETYGSTFTWSSSDSSVIAVSDTAATVVRPDKETGDKTVMLTVVSYNSGERYTHTIQVTVSAYKTSKSSITEVEPIQLMYKENFEGQQPWYNIKSNGKVGDYVEYQGYDSLKFDDLIDAASVQQEAGNTYASVKRFGTPDFGKTNTALRLYMSKGSQGVSAKHTDVGFADKFNYGVKIKLPDALNSGNSGKSSGVYIEATTQIASHYTGARAFMVEIRKADSSGFTYTYTTSEYSERLGKWQDSTSNEIRIDGFDIVNNYVDFTISIDPANYKYSFYADGKLLADNAVFNSVSRNDGRVNNVNSVSAGISRGGAIQSGEICFDDIRMFRDKTEYLYNIADELQDKDLTDEDLESVSNNLTLPTAVDGCPVKWSSSNPDAVSADGKVTRKAFTQTAELTAEFVPDSDVPIKESAYIKKKFNVTVKKTDSATAEQTVDGILNDCLTAAKLTDENAAEITKNLTLPTSLPDGATIGWTSDNTGVISNDGKVQRPAYNSENAQVKLTASVSLGGVTKTKEFTFTVLADISAQQKLAAAMQKVTCESINALNPSSVTANISLPKSGAYNTAISWSSSDDGVITSDGTVTRGSETKTVTLTAKFSADGEDNTKTFELTVPLNPKAMAQFDADAVTIENSGSIEEDIDLSSKGGEYRSAISWESLNPAVKISGNTGIVTRPENGSGDSTGDLALISDNDGYKVQRKISVTVKQQLSDSTYVDELFNALTFADISSESADAVTKNLALKTKCENGVVCEWKSLTPNAVTDGGVVLRPSKGQNAADAEIQVTVSKGASSKTKSFKFKVKPFDSDEELVEKAARELTFGIISTEPISSVTQNLNLLDDWRYGTKVEWKSANTNLISDKGEVNTKALMVSEQNVILTAKISYGGVTKEKKFNVTVCKTADTLVLCDQDIEDFQIGALTKEAVSDLGGYFNYSTIAVSKMKADVVADPKDSSNRVIKMSSTTQGYNNLAYIFDKSESTYGGNMTFKLKLYIPSTNGETGAARQDWFMFELRGNHGGIVTMYFNADKTLTYNANGQNCINKNIKYEQDKWLSLVIETNTHHRSYKAYLDGVDITNPDDIYVTSTGAVYKNSYDNSLGVEFVYARSKAPEPVISMIRLHTRGRTGDEVYADDWYAERTGDVDDTVVNEMKYFESEFTSMQDISAVTDDLVYPEWGKDKKTTLTFKSSDTSVITDDGKISRGKTNKTVQYTVSFKKDSSIIEKTFDITVLHDSKYNPENILDEAYNWLGEYFTKNYTLNSIASSLTLPTEYESVKIDWASSDESAVSKTGVVTRGSANKNVTLTATLTIGDLKKTRTVDLTVVKADSPSGGESGSGGGGGVSGGKVPLVVDPSNNNGEETTGFKDVGDSYWAAKQIKYLFDKKLISGRGDNLYEPEATVTRAEFVKLILGGMGIEATAKDTRFGDISPSDWAYPFITTAESIGLINGVTETNFGADANITRQDMAVIICRALTERGVIDAESGAKGEEFADDSEVSDYAKDAVYLLRGANILNGRGDNRFDPTEFVTRAEAAAVIYNLLQIQ